MKPMISGVYINLDRAVERRSVIEQQLAALDLPYPMRRLPATDGLERKERPAKLTPSRYGCWLSHLSAIESSIEDDDHLYVLEDDALSTFTLYGLLSYVVNSRRKRSGSRFLRDNFERGKPIDSITAHGIHRGALKAYVTVPLLTCGSELARSSQIEAADDGRNLARLLFRRLCFIRRDAESLRDLSAAVRRLTSGFEEPEKLLGLLVSNRVMRFPNARFEPMLGEK
jgi:hypothetical protein